MKRKIENHQVSFWAWSLSQVNDDVIFSRSEKIKTQNILMSMVSLDSKSKTENEILKNLCHLTYGLGMTSSQRLTME